jgi:hypothetical protein
MFLRIRIINRVLNLNKWQIYGPNVVKRFTPVNYKLSQFVPSKHLQPSLMFVVKAKSIPLIDAPERCFIRLGYSLTHKH